MKSAGTVWCQQSILHPLKWCRHSFGDMPLLDMRGALILICECRYMGSRERSIEGMAMAEMVRAWTRQGLAVLDALQRDGIYHAREEFVSEKYDSIADHYLGLYHWLIAGCRAHGASIPEDATLPIWIALTESQKLGETEGTVMFDLEIPRDQIAIIDGDRWGYRVNNWYVPLDLADEEAHNAELERLGIANESLVVTGPLGNYHPALKGKIQRSWERVFTPAESMEKNLGLCWELRTSWVRGYTIGEGA